MPVQGVVDRRATYAALTYGAGAEASQATNPALSSLLGSLVQNWFSPTLPPF
jgi:hypothetical protein